LSDLNASELGKSEAKVSIFGGTEWNMGPVAFRFYR
jgi:hypothetical protein